MRRAELRQQIIVAVAEHHECALPRPAVWLQHVEDHLLAGRGREARRGDRLVRGEEEVRREANAVQIGRRVHAEPGPERLGAVVHRLLAAVVAVVADEAIRDRLGLPAEGGAVAAEVEAVLVDQDVLGDPLPLAVLVRVGDDGTGAGRRRVAAHRIDEGRILRLDDQGADQALLAELDRIAHRDQISWAEGFGPSDQIDRAGLVYRGHRFDDAGIPVEEKSIGGWGARWPAVAGM